MCIRDRVNGVNSTQLLMLIIYIYFCCVSGASISSTLAKPILSRFMRLSFNNKKVNTYQQIKWNGTRAWRMCCESSSIKHSWSWNFIFHQFLGWERKTNYGWTVFKDSTHVWLFDEYIQICHFQRKWCNFVAKLITFWRYTHFCGFKVVCIPPCFADGTWTGVMMIYICYS